MQRLWNTLSSFYHRTPAAADCKPAAKTQASHLPHAAASGDMFETVQACDKASGSRPYAHVLLGDAAIYMDPWCAATVVAQLANHALSVLAQISFLGAATAAAKGDDPMPSFQRFATIALVLATVPKTVAAFTGQKWQHAALKRYDQAFIAGDFRRPRTWVMRQGATAGEDGAPAPNQEAVRTALFKERLRWGVAGTVDASRQLIDDVSLAVINGAFFSLAMGPQLTAAMVVAVGLTQGLGWASRASKADANRAREAAYTDAFAEGLKVWDNLVLGNPVNRDPWLQDLTRARHAWVDAGAREQSAQLQRSWLGSVAAGAPVLLAATHHAMTLAGRGGPQALASELLPVMPRLLSVVSNANALRNTVWDRFVGTRQGLLDTLQAARERPTLDTEALIKPEWITVSHNNGPERPLPDVAAALHAAVSRGEPGRWTIRGRNTAGKSMTLLSLKEAGASAPAQRADIAPGAFLLPAKSRLSFAFQTGSSGETGLAHVQETLQRGPQVLMFDECAAHLDEANSAQTDRLLDDAAQQRTIVDIRHR